MLRMPESMLEVQLETRAESPLFNTGHKLTRCSRNALQVLAGHIVLEAILSEQRITEPVPSCLKLSNKLLQTSKEAECAVISISE